MPQAIDAHDAMVDFDYTSVRYLTVKDAYAKLHEPEKSSKLGFYCTTPFPVVELDEEDHNITSLADFNKALLAMEEGAGERWTWPAAGLLRHRLDGGSVLMPPRPAGPPAAAPHGAAAATPAAAAGSSGGGSGGSGGDGGPGGARDGGAANRVATRSDRAAAAAAAGGGAR